MIGVLVVDEHESWRQHVRATLQRYPRCVIVGETGNGIEAVRKAAELQPDLILLEVSLPMLNGLEAATLILAANPGFSILFYSEQRSQSIIRAALQLGAKGYLLKSDAHRLVEAIEAVYVGGTFVSERVRDHEH